jgi:hypothetical protein
LRNSSHSARLAGITRSNVPATRSSRVRNLLERIYFEYGKLPVRYPPSSYKFCAVCSDSVRQQRHDGFLRHAPEIADAMVEVWKPGSHLFVVFVATSILRSTVVAFFMPRLTEPKIRNRPKLLDVIFRIARISSVSGVSLDWMSVTRKKPTDETRSSETPKEPD